MVLASYIPYIVELCACEAKRSWRSCTSGEQLEGAAPRRSRWFIPSRGGRRTAMGTKDVAAANEEAEMHKGEEEKRALDQDTPISA